MEEWAEGLNKDEWRDWITSRAGELFFDNLAGRLDEVKLRFYNRIAAATDKEAMWTDRCEMKGRVEELRAAIAQAKELGGLDGDSA